MVNSKQDIIDPETGLIMYESSIKSGTHGEVYQKQLAQILLLRLTRAAKEFHLAYELTAADKFDDVVLYDRTAKQWTFVQVKHADGKDSKIDLNGLLPKTNRMKADFSLYKYFTSYMLIRNRFKGRANFVLFTNKKLDEKLITAEDCMAINDRNVDEYLRFSSKEATHKVLTPTESTIQSIVEYANKDLYSLKDAIKQLFTDGIITNELQQYNAYLNDILKQSRNYQIRFNETFNDSLIFIAKVYRVLQPELPNLKPIDKPQELNIGEEASHESPKCLTVEGQDFDHLIEDIKNLFHNGIVSNHLKKYENLLALFLTTSANGQLEIKDTFNSDIVFKAELYKMLKAELSDLNKEIKTKRKLFDLKDSRRKYHSVLFYAEASDVREFFALLTLSVHQPEELEPFIVEELYTWMRMWLRPDVLGKLTEYDDKNAVKDLDDHFEATLKCEQGNSKPYLNQQFVSQYCNRLRSRIAALYPELNDTNQLYINRVLVFEKENIDAAEHIKDAKCNGNRKSGLYSSSVRLNTNDYDALENDLEKDDSIPLPDKTYEEMTDTQFAINLNSKFENYQCLVLTADPGIGKTELLQYVALEHQKCKSGAVFLFYLNRLQDYVSKNKPSMDILKSGLSQKNVELIQNVLKNKSNDHITILFDGYDEIHEKNRNRINNLFVLLLLKSKQIQLIISVRNHEKKTLQSFFKKHKIQAYYFSLEPFNNENIFEYLAESWKENAKCYVSSKFNSYSKFLVDTFYSFCRVPLMVKMMAEIYKQRFQHFKETSMIDKGGEISYLEREFLEVEHIYEAFIEKCLLVKIETACNGIGQVDSNKQIFDGFYLDHQLLAIECLDIGELKFIFNNPKYNQKRDCFLKRHLNRFEKSILVKFVGDKVFFSHNSYAEYFVAKFLWDDFIYLKSIIKNVLTVFTGIRHFFIKIIEKNYDFFVSEITRVTSFVSKTVAFWACESNAVKLLKYVRSKKFSIRPKKAKMLSIAIRNGSDKICSYLIDDCKVHPDFKYDGGLVPLHSAIIYGHRNLVHLLLQKGADIHIQNTEGWSALHYAVHHKQIAITTLLIDNGIDVNCLNKNKWNALHISCNNGDADLTKMLIQRGALLDTQTNEGKTPLHLAAAGGHTKVVSILTENLIKKCPLNDMICNAYEIAVLHGHKPVTEMLIEKFPEFAKSSKDEDDLLIHCAAQEGMFKKVRKLIDDGANVNALNATKLTALHLSSSAGHSLVAELLLNNGANVNTAGRNGWTPLHFACQNDHKEVVHTLIKNGANIESLNNDNWTALHISAFQGHCNIVNLLLNKGANVNVVGKHGMTPLFSACQNGHKDVVQTLIKRGANINALSYKKWTALHKSASEGHCDIVNLLLDKGAKVNAVDIGEWTPLHWACQNGHKEVVETLIKKGANIHAFTRTNWTALHESASKGYCDIVGLLLDKGANVNAVELENCTSLHRACRNGHKEVVKTLLKRGAKIDALTHNNWTVLHECASEGHCGVVDLLLDKGVNINAVDRDNWTPLHWTCKNGHEEVVKTLLRRGASIDALTDNNWTALHLSASKGHCGVVDLVLDKGANINAVDMDNWTPLHWTCKNGHEEVVKTLLRRGASIDALTNNNWTALHMSASNGHYSVVDLLLHKGANIDAVEMDKWTPLHWACQYGHEEVAEILLRRGANFNALTHNNWTALHKSASNGHCAIVDLLLDKGANVNAVEMDKWTPLHLASQNGHQDVVKTLISRGANINALTNDNWTALHASAFIGSSVIVNYLLDKAANVNTVDRDKWTPLHWSCMNGHNKVVKTLLRRGANINQLAKNNYTALHVSASKGHCAIVDLLLDKGANVNVVEIDKLTPLHWACRNGHKIVVETLIRRGANIDAYTYNEWSALHVSASRGHCDIVDILLDKDANVNALEMHKWTPLHLACQNGHKDVVEILVRRGANIDAMTHNTCTTLHANASKGYRNIEAPVPKNGVNVNVLEIDQWTPLHVSCKNGHQDVVEILTRNGANINALTHKKCTTLHISAFEGHRHIVDFLLDKGANVNAMEIDNWTPLQLASQNGHKDVVETLIKRDANINEVTQNAWTALHVSAFNGHRDVVSLLLDRGANVNAVELDKWTPLHRACQNGHKYVVEILLRRGANINAVTQNAWTALHVSAFNGHRDVWCLRK